MSLIYVNDKVIDDVFAEERRKAAAQYQTIEVDESVIDEIEEAPADPAIGLPPEQPTIDKPAPVLDIVDANGWAQTFGKEIPRGLSKEEAQAMLRPVEPRLKGDDFLKAVESPGGEARFDVYDDLNSSKSHTPGQPVEGKLTAGWGHVLTKEELEAYKNGDLTIDKEQVQRWWEQDKQDAIRKIGKDTYERLTPNQKAGALSYIFNVGSSPKFIKALRAGDYERAAKEMDVVTAGGEFKRGYIPRRSAEQWLVLDKTPAPAAQPQPAPEAQEPAPRTLTVGQRLAQIKASRDAEAAQAARQEERSAVDRKADLDALSHIRQAQHMKVNGVDYIRTEEGKWLQNQRREL